MTTIDEVLGIEEDDVSMFICVEGLDDAAIGTCLVDGDEVVAYDFSKVLEICSRWRGWDAVETICWIDSIQEEFSLNTSPIFINVDPTLAPSLSAGRGKFN